MLCEANDELTSLTRCCPPINSINWTILILIQKLKHELCWENNQVYLKGFVHSVTMLFEANNELSSLTHSCPMINWIDWKSSALIEKLKHELCWENNQVYFEGFFIQLRCYLKLIWAVKVNSASVLDLNRSTNGDDVEFLDTYFVAAIKTNQFGFYIFILFG